MNALAYFFIFLTVLIIIFYIDSRVKRHERKLKRPMEIEFPSRLSEQVKQMALDPARKIEAIKLYREETKASLKDAKDAVEDFLNNADKNTDKFL